MDSFGSGRRNAEKKQNWNQQTRRGVEKEKDEYSKDVARQMKVLEDRVILSENIRERFETDQKNMMDVQRVLTLKRFKQGMVPWVFGSLKSIS